MSPPEPPPGTATPAGAQEPETAARTRRHAGEPHGRGPSRLGWLRAGVLGANDGIVSTAALVVGVAGATTDRAALLTAGAAGLVAGAVSMGLGEYVSVSTQRDSESALLAQERRELDAMPREELDELAALYEEKGLTPGTARQVAEELTAHDAFAAHVDVELGLDPDELSRPWQAAGTSALAFTTGALLPLLAVLLPPLTWRVPATFVAVFAALVVTGATSAHLGGSSVRVAVLRLVVGGSAAMVVSYLVGMTLGGMTGA